MVNMDILDILKNRNIDTDVHNLIRIAAKRLGATQDIINLCREIISSKEDDWWMQGAVYAISEDLNRTEDFTRELLSTIEKYQWDAFPDTAIASFSALGIYANRSEDKYIIGELTKCLFEEIEEFDKNVGSRRPVRLEVICRSLDVSLRGPEGIYRPLRVSRPEDIPDYLLSHVDD